MREYKFRVWDLEKKFYLNQDDEFHFYEPDRGWQCPIPLCECLRDKKRYVVQQCTEIRDKKNYLIFEGDIIKEHHFEDWGDKIGYEYIGIVVYKEYSDDILYAGYKTIPAKNQNIKFRGNAIQSDCEVIGNIFENPELLKTI